MQLKINSKIFLRLAILLGIIGSFIGAYYWWNFHIPDFWMPNERENLLKNLYRETSYRQYEMAYLLLFFVPSCLGIIGAVFKKAHFLYLAFLLSLPVGEYIGFKAHSINFVHFPLYFYLASAILFSMIKKQK
ncbi:hypothetical protein [Halobacillus ihumii]|uniref:hypothetical protein n=1 Tax=Halobacillus ihumii TaxID=2686092 RepID=UPI0013D3AC0C|nr:hypothetical protein [Halobacillus ihumii]